MRKAKSIFMAVVLIHALLSAQNDPNHPNYLGRLQVAIPYVLNAYERKILGKKHLYYPAKNPKRLYIIFSPAAHKYMMWSWFWDQDEAWGETAYLFLQDETNSWYLGHKNASLLPIFSQIITYYVQDCNLESHQVYMIGSSKGGYAALLYGIQLKVQGIFAFRPQIDYENAVQAFKVKELKDVWIDLNELANHADYIPNMYVQYGNFKPDRQALDRFINVLKSKQSLVLFHRTLHPDHVGFTPTKAFIEQTLLYLEKANIDGTVKKRLIRSGIKYDIIDTI